MQIAACVLAAGASRRMGAPKALLTIGGRAYVELLLDAFQDATVAPRYVVGRAEFDPIHAICTARGGRFLVNPDPERGMLSSLHVCLQAILGPATAGAGAEPIAALFVAPVDCPRVRAATIAALCRAFIATGAPIVVPRHGDRRGHPTLFAAALFDELLQAPLATGARAVVRAHARDRLEVPVDDPAVLDDIDSPADAARLDSRPSEPDRT